MMTTWSQLILRETRLVQIKPANKKLNNLSIQFCFSARDLFNSSIIGNKVLIPDNKNVTVPINNEFIISIISSMDTGVSREFKLRELIMSNASLLPLYYSDVSRLS